MFVTSKVVPDLARPDVYYTSRGRMTRRAAHRMILALTRSDVQAFDVSGWRTEAAYRRGDARRYGATVKRPNLKADCFLIHPEGACDR